MHISAAPTSQRWPRSPIDAPTPEADPERSGLRHRPRALSSGAPGSTSCAITRPGSAPVCLPSSSSTWPFTIVMWMPIRRLLDAPAAGGEVVHHALLARLHRVGIEQHDVRRQALAQQAAVADAEQRCRLEGQPPHRLLQRHRLLLAHPLAEQPRRVAVAAVELHVRAAVAQPDERVRIGQDAASPPRRRCCSRPAGSGSPASPRPPDRGTRRSPACSASWRSRRSS